MAKGWLKYTIQDMHELARTRGFDFLSDHYKGITTKHLWRCRQGHTWKATPSAIKTGNGCKRCAAAQLRTSINDVYKLAENRSFVFLSREFRGMRRKHLWGCKDGHTWEAKPSAIKSGSGCPKCRKLSEEKVRFLFESLTQEEFPTNRTILSRLELDGYCKRLSIAFEYQGEQHYDPQNYYHKTIGSFTDLKERDRQKVYECSKLNIALLVIPYTESKDRKKLEQIIKTFLIRFCLPIFSVDWSKFESSKSKLSKLTKMAKEQNITLVDKAYLGAHCKHTFQCIECDYIWRTEARHITKRSCGCPVCAGNQKYTREQVQDIVQNKQIALLSRTYKNAHTKCRWKCMKCDYVWRTAFNHIKQKTGCPKCAGNIKCTIEDMRTLAKERNLEFLSIEYTRSTDKHTWKCKICNHIWEACPVMIKRGNGCPSRGCVMAKKANTRQLNKARKGVN